MKEVVIGGGGVVAHRLTCFDIEVRKCADNDRQFGLRYISPLGSRHCVRFDHYPSATEINEYILKVNREKTERIRKENIV